jgi:DNA repair protein RAD50
LWFINQFDRNDQVCVAVRSMQLTKKKTKTEYKALDAVLRTTSKNGERVSIPIKCAELDKVIPMNLGVSSAVLESVIFCHQEESTWPMQEPTVVKKKFDDIFESTRYTKALEQFMMTKKEYVNIAKDLKVEVAELSAHQQAAKATRRELQKIEVIYKSCDWFLLCQTLHQLSNCAAIAH